MANIGTISMFDLLPSSLRGDAAVVAAAQALDGEMQAVTAAINEVLILPRIAELDSDILDHLAVRFDVDFYDQSLSVEQKRELVLNAIKWHKIKGTPGAVKLATGALGYDLDLTEWHQKTPRGAPYTFSATINVDQVGFSTASIFDEIEQAANAAKNARSQLSSIGISATTSGTEYIGAALWMGETVNLSAESGTVVINENVFAG